MTINSNPALQVNQIPVSLDLPRDYESAKEILSLLLKRLEDAMNKKEGSLYYLEEMGNFQSYFFPDAPYQFRDVYRYVFDLVSLNGGNIAGGTSVKFAHGIVGITNGTLIYASCTATDSTTFTVTYPNAYMDNTYIYFTNPLADTALTACYFVAQYCKI